MSIRQEYRNDIVCYEDHEVLIQYDQFGNITDRDIRYYNPDDTDLNGDISDTI